MRDRRPEVGVTLGGVTWQRSRASEMAIAAANLVEVDTRIYMAERPDGLLKLMVSHDPGLGWHISISHTERYPTWDEIKDVRYAFLPDDITMGILLPPPSEYVNIHPNCFHLHQVPNDGEWSPHA